MFYSIVVEMGFHKVMQAYCQHPLWGPGVRSEANLIAAQQKELPVYWSESLVARSTCEVWKSVFFKDSTLYL